MRCNNPTARRLERAGNLRRVERRAGIDGQDGSASSITYQTDNRSFLPQSQKNPDGTRTCKRARRCSMSATWLEFGYSSPAK